MGAFCHTLYGPNAGTRQIAGHLVRMTWRLAAINKSFKETVPLLWGYKRMDYKHERSTLAVRKDCEPLLVS